MTIIETKKEAEDKSGAQEKTKDSTAVSAPTAEDNGDPEKRDNFFSDENMSKDTDMETKVPVGKEINLGKMKRTITITKEDKTSFVDAIVNNTRFTRDYSLFGGRVTLTARSLTSDEVNALAAWTIKSGSNDPVGLSAGKYRKFLAAAQIAKFNGIEMPPLEEPLFEHLGSDGKTVEPPGWVNRFAYWEKMEHGLFNAVLGCLADFDIRYSELCRKAEDSNFWNPDTP